MSQFETIFHPAELVFQSKDYTSATMLYFKTMFVALDVIIQKRIGKTPKDHTERFRILEKEFPLFYSMLHSLFQVYRDTYSKEISKETCEEIRNETITILEKI